MIAVLAGGVGAARFLEGLVRVVAESELTVIGNTGDDAILHGLHVSPDLDTVTYTLAGASNLETGWGLAGDSFRTMGALDRYHVPTWFRLGDLDLATHLFRTVRLAEGAALSEVTAEIAATWGLGFRLLPMTDDTVRTRLRLANGEEVDFQEYFVRLRHDVVVASIAYDGAEAATPAPGVLAALAEAEAILIAPSNPLLSIAPILAVPGIGAAVERRRERVVAVSPIVGGRALRGPADRLLAELGHESSAVGVARLLGGYAGCLVIDTTDANLHPDVVAAGVRAVVADTVMRTPEVAAALARVRARRRRGRAAMTSPSLAVIGVEGLPEIVPGTSIGAVLARRAPLVSGDVVVVTQKIVSKAEGRVVPVAAGDPDAKRRLAEAEATRILRCRGELVITETRHGFVCANSGVDLSNVAEGFAVLLPADPDRSARGIRDAVRALAGIEIGVIISDTFGRAWRRGLVDVAIGCAGVAAVVDLRGSLDGSGRVLAATEMCVADEIAAAAELVMGKAAHVPVAIVRGVDASWLRESSVATEVVRPHGEDLFR